MSEPVNLPKEMRRVSAFAISSAHRVNSSVSGEMYIYLITNKINGKRYVGQTKKANPIQRWKEHLCKARHSSMLISRAINKYGGDNFTFEVLEKVEDATQLSPLEADYIVRLGTLHPSGYNMEIYDGSEHICHPQTKECLSRLNQGAKKLNKLWSQYIGVAKKQHGYVGGIRKGPRFYSQSYTTEKEAAIGYDIMAIHLYGSSAQLNFPDRCESYSPAFVAHTIDIFMNKRTSSPYIGVVYNKAKKRWTGHIKVNGERHSRLFLTEKEAAEFVDVVRVQRGGSLGMLNFPDRIATYTSTSIDTFACRAFGHLKTRGVGYDKVNRKYTAYLDEGDVRIWCGRHETLEQAKDAIEAKRISLLA